jgi:2-polyprenyl-3-methyl-5-hydroxy-6-metoxy-1,4-benzoquinol methylase
MAQRNSVTSAQMMRLMMDEWGLQRALAIGAAHQLDLFTYAAPGARTAQEIATAAGTNANATERLLNAMVALGYMRKSRGKFSTAPLARTFLARGSELYQEHVNDVMRGITAVWMTLADSVRTGRALASPPDGGAAIFRILVGQIFPVSYCGAEGAVRALGAARRKRIRRVLDVGAGSAAWSIPFARANRSVRVTTIDLPEVTAITREYAKRFGLAARYDYREGSMFDLDWGANEYDLVILGHIIHSWGEQKGRELMRRAHRALRDGGMLLIAEISPNEDRTAPLFSVLFSLNMLVTSPDGDVFTLKQMRGWLKEEGYRKSELLRVPAPSPLILATK